MKKVVKGAFALLMVLSVLSTVNQVSASPTLAADRTISGTICPGSTFTVTITLDVTGSPVNGLSIAEDLSALPDGWTVAPNDGGIYNARSKKLEYIWFDPSGSIGDKTVTYDVTVSGDATVGESYDITGKAELTPPKTTADIGTDTVTVIECEDSLSVTVLYPNGGESIPIGTQVQVSARATDDSAVTGVTFYYSTGSTWNLIGAGTRVSGTAKDGIWNITWNTNGLGAGTNYKIKAVASDGTSTSEDLSDSTFSLIGTTPPAPTLNDPGTTDTDGSYTVSWSSVSGATSYTLEEDTSSSFSSPEVYTEAGTSKDVSGKSDGTYYYRVKACNAEGCSGWSNVEDIEVEISTGTVLTIVSYTISHSTITPPQTTEIDVAFSEKVSYKIAIENAIGTIYDWTGSAKDPQAKIWDGTYEADGTVVPAGDYTVNVTGTNTTTGECVVNNTEVITVTTGTPSKILYVPDVYSTLQAAVDSASTGDTIIVRDGVYTGNIIVNKPHLTIMSENGAGNCIVQAANADDDVFNVTTDYVDISGFTIRGGSNGVSVSLVDVDYCSILNNIVADNSGDCIWLHNSSSNTIANNILSGNSGCSLVLEDYSNSNIISNNTISSNVGDCIQLDYSSSNIISNNLISGNVGDCIGLDKSSSNTLANNIISGNSGCSLVLEDYSNSNIITNNLISDNDGCCIVLDLSSNNKIYLNNFMNNRENVRSSDSTNIWESPSKITYSYKGNTYTNYLGNYWSDYTRLDANGDGIGDTPFSINLDKDNYPLMQPLENYSELQEEKIFDTDSPANPYPSIPGTHTGTITPSHDIAVQKLYTYPCTGTGGHTESVRIYGNGKDESTARTSYAEDGDTITFDSSFTLESGKTYNYVIETGSYPQIHHKKALQTETGWLNCTKFTDANGKEYDDWIPAIKLGS